MAKKLVYLFFFSLISSISIISCSSEEMGFIEPFEFIVKEFKVPEFKIPVERPAVVEPVIPIAKTPQETQQQVSQLSAATSPQDIPLSVQTTISAASSVLAAAGVSPTTIQNFDKSDFKTIASTPPANLDQNILKAAQQALANPTLKALFPFISNPLSGGRSTTGSVESDRGNDVLLPPQVLEEVTGPCADKARDLFDEALQALEEWALNLQTVELDKSFSPLYAELDPRLKTRNDAAKSLYESQIITLDFLVGQILDAADRFQQIAGGEQLSLEIRGFALLYYYYSYSFYVSIYTQTLELNELARGNEEANINEAKLKAFNAIQDKFLETKEIYEKALVKALNDCHNQGGGN